MYCHFCNDDRYDKIYSIKFKKLNIMYICPECLQREVPNYSVANTIPIFKCMYCGLSLLYDVDLGRHPVNKTPFKIVEITQPHNATLKEQMLMNAMCGGCADTNLGLGYIVFLEKHNLAKGYE